LAGLVAFAGPNAQTNAGSYNHIELEVTPGKVTVTLNGKLVEVLTMPASPRPFASNARQRRRSRHEGSIHIDNVVIGKIVAGKAKDPNPDGVTNVARDGTLSWTAGEFAKTHNVYLGDTFADVNSADLSKAVGKGQEGNTFTPAAPLEYGKTYYWRVDEVNAAPEQCGLQGRCVELHGRDVCLSDSGGEHHSDGFQSGQEHDRTGQYDQWLRPGQRFALDRRNGHVLSSMTGATPVWIRYQFDKVYKLQEMWVWNHNTEFEPVLGYGSKDVTLETSTDGTNWTALKDVQFAQATALAGYAHNTTSGTWAESWPGTSG